ncbi:MAG TPA: hypothetical protein VHE32_08155 [Rhodanobacteraceae bacterium]|nr:hypothetical protein [Rhodanobacteraceae bacterium]
MSSDRRIAEKRIAVIGVSDEETAHLRLLMRKAESELGARWRWDNESAADLLVVDPSSFAGQMARTRALAAGMRCAVFSDEPVAGSDLVLMRPLKLANVVEVLNDAAGRAMRAEGIEPQQHDFYVLDVGETDDAIETSAIDEPAPARARQAGAAPGLDELLKVDPAEAREAARVKATLDENTTVFGTSGPTARSEARGGGLGGRQAAHDSAPPDPGLIRRGSGDHARHDLRDYLKGDLLGGPARIRLADAPSLVLDPKHRMFHSEGRLAALEPYCRTPLRRSDFEPLTSAELAELRSTVPAQPYLRLVWLDALLHSGGQLARHLDPGGTYRLSRWLEIEGDFSAYFRIASAMLQPARLHEIAAASGGQMADVFDVVNAYDAIGLIEWQPRTPRGPEPAEKGGPGLLGRLRRTLRKP